MTSAAIPGPVRRSAHAFRAFLALAWAQPLMLAVVLCCIRGVVMITWPLYIEGDGRAYYEMTRSGVSNLLHATGSCWLLQPVRLIASVSGLELARVLPFCHHGLGVAASVALWLATHRLVSKPVAWFIALLPGFEAMGLAYAQTTRPEFFQPVFLTLTIAAVLTAQRCVTWKATRLWWFAAGAFFAVGVLVKFNLAPFGAVLLLPFFVESTMSRRLTSLAMTALGTVTIVLSFLVTFHVPTTKTWHLHAGGGWFKLQKLDDAGLTLSPDNGIATRCYLVLATALPPIVPGAAPWRRARPLETQSVFPAETWQDLLDARPCATVESEFLRVSGHLRPASEYLKPEAFVRVFHFAGPLAADALLARVYDEAVAMQWPALARNVIARFVEGLDPSAHFGNDRLQGTPWTLEETWTPVAPPGLRIVVVTNESEANREQLSSQVWGPGASALAPLAWFRRVHWAAIWGPIVAGALATALILRRRSKDILSWLYLCLLVGLVGCILFSAYVHRFRFKELILCLPVYCLLVPVGITQIVNLVRHRRNLAG